MASPSNPTREDERATAISTFQTITGVESAALAERELSACDWDLNRALDHYMEHGPRASPPARPVARQERRAIPRRGERRGFLSWLVQIVWAPFELVTQIAAQVWQAIGSLLAGPYQAIPGGWQGFKEFYNRKYGHNHVSFYEGTYWDAMAKCQEDVKFLVVYLHAEAHVLTREFCQSVLRSEALSRRLREGRMVFWAGSVGGREGTAIQRALRVSGFPYIGIIEAPKMKVERRERGVQGMSVALGRRPLRAEGYGRLLSCKVGQDALRGGDTEMIAWLDRIENRYGLRLDAIIAERRERENQRLLREEQDAAFRASLEADRAAAEAKQKKEEEEKAQRMLEQAKEDRRKRKEAQLGQEPEKGPDVCALRLRKPDGSTVMRRFKQGERLEKVFDWAEVVGVDVQVTALVCTYPRKQWRYPEDAETTLEDAGFFPSAILMMEERDDSEHAGTHQ